MIQRIQTIYLTIALVIGILLATQTSSLPASTLHYVQAGIIIITLLLTLFTIFRYTNRKQQLLFCNILLLFNGLCAALCITENHFLLTTANPIKLGPIPLEAFALINIVLIWMAKRGIKKDEDLVRSADRLR